jgi:hypothetical protein
MARNSNVMGTGRRGNLAGPRCGAPRYCNRAQTITPLLRRRVTALDDQQEPSRTAPRCPLTFASCTLADRLLRNSARQRSTAHRGCSGRAAAQPEPGKRSWRRRNTCFPPCVSLHLFRSMGFSLERNRPPPRLRVFPWLPAWALGGRGVRRFAPDSPSSTVQVNLDGPAQAGSWSGLRRGGGRGDRARQIGWAGMR